MSGDPSSPTLSALQHDVLRVCTEAEAPAESLTRLGDERIWRVYRGMVRSRLLGELKVAYKRTLAAAGDALFEAAFRHYMATDPPRARYFHAVPATFEASAVGFFDRAAANDAAVKPYLSDLVRFEAARWTVMDLDDRVPEPEQIEEVSFEGRPVLSPALRLLSLSHAVQNKPDAAGDYAAGRTYLALHRAGDDQPVRVWKLNRVGYGLLTELEGKPASLTFAVQQLAERLELAIDERFLEGLCETLATFSDRGILLGSRPVVPGGGITTGDSSR